MAYSFFTTETVTALVLTAAQFIGPHAVWVKHKIIASEITMEWLCDSSAGQNSRLSELRDEVSNTVGQEYKEVRDIYRNIRLAETRRISIRDAPSESIRRQIESRDAEEIVLWAYAENCSFVSKSELVLVVWLREGSVIEGELSLNTISI